MGIDYAETQRYIQHYRAKGCDPSIIDNTEGVFNFCLFLLSEVDRLTQEVEKKSINIARLKEIVFGMAIPDDSPKNSDDSVDKGSDTTPEPTANDDQRDSDKKPKKKIKGHGRLGADAYTGANTVVCACDYSEGDQCPQCHRGRLKLIDPKIKIHIDGKAPLFATRYELEQLVCSFCDWSTSAPAPKGVDLSQKYTEQAKATLAFLHYGMGLPFYRFSKMQKMLGVPLAVSTQSDLMESMMGPVHAIFNALAWIMAQSDLIHQDDTTVRISELIKENLQLNPDRRGMFSTGFIGEGEHTVVLFYSGRSHAGENFGDMIEAREANRGPVTRMADALAANSVHDPEDINEAKCNAHLFRRFRTLLSTYPEAAKYVLHTYGQIYDHDEHCKTNNLDDYARLAYHQEHSEPLMDNMKNWIGDVQLACEPNSPLARECNYLLNHWKELTLFLRAPGVPLDNNRLEAMLKFMICYRKNSLLFKTAYSADYGSRLISLIVTCMVNDINAIDYLTQIQRYESHVWSNPHAWLPWSYQQTLAQLTMKQVV